MTLLWLQRKGVPIKVSRFLGWLLKAAALITLLYVAFWITLIVLVITVGAIGVLRSNDPPEWRSGPEGYGYYENGVRTDFGRLFEDDE
jgi:hypothetical protein